MEVIKRKTLNSIALTLLGKPLLEKLLCDLSSSSFIRNRFKIGAIPFSYLLVLDKPEIRIAKVGKYQVYVNIAEHQGISLYFLREHNEPFSAWLASELVDEGDICIDIGANMGSYTFLMASRVGSGGKVFAFEPNPELNKMLLDSVHINQCESWISVDNRALYSQSGEYLKFYLSNNPSNSGTSSLVNHGTFVNEGNFILVETITLKDCFKENKIDKCNLIKIDVERAELDVLTGAIDLLKERRIDYIILEQLGGSESQNLLSSVGYTCWLIDEARKVLIDNQQIKEDYFGNYLFVSPTCIDQFKNDFSRIIAN